MDDVVFFLVTFFYKSFCLGLFSPFCLTLHCLCKQGQIPTQIFTCDSNCFGQYETSIGVVAVVKHADPYITQGFRCKLYMCRNKCVIGEKGNGKPPHKIHLSFCRACSQVNFLGYPILFLLLLVSYVGERPWRLMQCLNKGRKKKNLKLKNTNLKW